MARFEPYGPRRLKGVALAKAYAASFSYLGNVWGTYEGGGWIVIQGSRLAPHPDLREQYPNGWELFSRVRTGEARARLNAMTGQHGLDRPRAARRTNG